MAPVVTKSVGVAVGDEVGVSRIVEFHCERQRVVAIHPLARVIVSRVRVTVV